MSKEYKVRRYGYDRRQKHKQNTIKTILLIVVIVGACVAGWFLYEPVYQWVQGYVAEQQNKQQAEANKPQENPTADPGTTEEPEPPAVPENPADDSVFPAKSITVDAARLTDTAGLKTLFEGLAAQGYTGVVFDLKDESGLVLYQSTLDAVTKNMFQTAKRYDLPAVISAAKEAGLAPIGRLCAFRDYMATRYLPDAAVKYNYTKTNWIDNDSSAGGKSWLNPNSTEAQEYLLALMKEATDAGLTQVILDKVQFPEGYSLNLATYAAKGVTVDKSAVLSAFSEKAKAQADAAGCKVWLSVSVRAAAGVENIRYGTELSKLLKAAENVVIDVTPEQFGSGVTSDTLNLKNPVKDPYGTVKAALEASALLKNDSLTTVAWVQGYTSASVPSGSNLTYGEPEIEQQLKAAQEYGISYAIIASKG